MRSPSRSRKDATSAAPIATRSRASSAQRAKNMPMDIAGSRGRPAAGRCRTAGRQAQSRLPRRRAARQPQRAASTTARARELARERGVAVELLDHHQRHAADRGRAEFFEQHGFAVTVSLDGPREAHDRLRPYQGRPRQLSIASCANAAAAAGAAARMQVSARVTVTPRNLEAARDARRFHRRSASTASASRRC